MTGHISNLIKRFQTNFKDNDNRDNKIKHEMRVMEELRDAGFGAGQLRHLESRRLPGIIEKDEHIKAAIYGKAEIKGSAIIVATDKRVIYFDHTPFLDTLDEFSYNVISGISYSTNGFSWSITVHIRLGDRTLESVKNNQADKFINYIESASIDQPLNV